MRFFIVLFFSLHITTAANAEEGGAGAYTPGAIASAIDSMLPSSGTIVRANYYNYSGRNNIGCTDAACNSVLVVDVESQAVSLTLGWRPDIHMPEGWSYMMSATIPYVHSKVEARFTDAGGTTITTDYRSGLGDIELMPLNVSYHLDEESQLNFKGAIRVPSGKYSQNELANIGRNYWSYEPTIGYIYIDKESKSHFSVYSGVNFNSKNKATDYTSGTQAHIEFTAENRVPSSHNKGVWGFGATGYHYQQLEDDEQNNSDMQNSRSRSSGIGPVVSYTGMLGNEFSVIELKWLHDFASKNKFEGNTVLLKAGLIF